MTSLASTFEIEIAVKDLVTALSVVTSCMERKSVNPILSCVKLDIIDNSLIINATDGNIFIKQTVGSKVHSASCSVAVEGKLLERMLKGLSDETVQMTYLTNSNELLVKSPSFELKLVVMPVEDFPKFPQLSSEITFEMPCKELSNLINYTEFASSKEEIRYNLNGVCIHAAGTNKIHAAATDGFRLSTFCVETEKEAPQFKIILPSKTIDFLKQLDSPIFENHTIKAKINNNIIELSVFNTVIVSKLIDGTFPEYEGLIPQNNANKLVLRGSNFANAIERVAGITDEKSKAVQISISPQKLEIAAYTQSKGEAKQFISGESFKYSNETIKIAFQPKYILDVLNLFKIQEGSEIEILLKDPSSPIVITHNKLAHGRFVVMPIKI
jgi:DNA polymerase-3 subunit beta